jgi:hypothetical protein
MNDAATAARRRLLPRALLATLVAICLSMGPGMQRATAAEVPVFSDGFESGNLSGYRWVAHSSVQQSIVHTGAWAWRGTNPGGVPSYATRKLSGTGYQEMRVTAYVYLTSHMTSVKLFGVQSSDGRWVEVYVDGRSNRLSLRNNLGGVTTYSSTTVANGSWRKVSLHITAGDGTGTVDVQLDGVPVSGLTLTGQKLGRGPFFEVRLGDVAASAIFDIAVDDVVVTGV